MKLFLNADPVVKGVLLLLLAASVWSWAVIIDKLWRLGAASRSARDHEARAATARSPRELLAPEGQTARADPAGLVLSAGLAESTTELRPQPETPGERRDRIERAMRLALNAELRRLEFRLPFLATLGSAARAVCSRERPQGFEPWPCHCPPPARPARIAMRRSPKSM